MEDTTEEEPFFVRELECDAKRLQIKQWCVGDVSCVVWDAALVMSKFLENPLYFPRGFWNGKRVVDLGSGTGVTGLAAAVLGADVIVTDLPEVVPLMSMNIDLNKDVTTGSIAAEALVWGQDISSFLPKPDVILMADVVYYEEALSGLVKTLTELSASHTMVLLAYEERNTGNKPQLQQQFFQMVETYFSKSVVPIHKLDQTFSSEDIPVLVLSLKQS